MSVSKETCLIIEPFYHIILEENILENMGLGNNHDKKVRKISKNLKSLAQILFFFVFCFYLVITGKTLKAKWSSQGKGP